MTQDGNSLADLAQLDKPLGAEKRHRLALLAGIGAIAVVAGVAVLVYTSISSLVHTRRMVDHTHAVIQTLDSLLIEMEDAETRQRGYVITGERSFLGNPATNDAAIHRNLRSLSLMISDNPHQVITLKNLTFLMEAKLGLARQIIATRDSVGLDSAVAIIRTGRGRKLMDDVQGNVETMKGRELQLLRQRAQDERFSLRRAAFAGGTGVLVALLLALVAGLLFRRILRALAEGRSNAVYAETLLNATSEGIYGLNKSGDVTFVNRATGAILGYEPHEMTGFHAHTLFHHTRADGTPYPAKDCPMYRVLRGGGNGVIDNEIIWRKDGTSIPVEYSVNRMQDAEGGVGAVVSFRDITDSQLAETALRNSKESAEAANRAKSDFLARMSHELRTPLNSVIGFSNVLIRNKAENLSGQDLAHLDRIRKNGVNLLALINDILDLSKIEAGKMEVELGPVSLPEVVNDVMSQFETQVLEKGITLSAELPAKVAVIQSDSMKVQQILVNLIGNAIKFTDAGTVKVSITTDPLTDLPIALSVSDSGIGIPVSRISAIFDAFEQAEKSTTRRYGGTGLGLQICRSLCALLGFDLVVSSVEGKGSTFTIDLRPPAKIQTGLGEFLPSPEATAVGEDAMLRGKLVLIIDDDADARTLIAHQVASLGGRSAGAATGTDGLRIAREVSPDLITLDLLMPDMDGWSVMKALKADKELKDIPVVIVSMVSRDQGSGVVGALSVLPKPLERELLAKALKKGVGIGRVLVVEDDPDSQYLLASYLYEEGASEVRVVAGAEDALAELATFSPDLVLLDMITPQGGGNSFLHGLAQQSIENQPPIIVVTGKEFTSQETRELEIATLSIVTKGRDLEEKLKLQLRLFATNRARLSSGSTKHVD